MRLTVVGGSQTARQGLRGTNDPQFNRFGKLRAELQHARTMATHELKEQLRAYLAKISTRDSELTCAHAESDNARGIIAVDKLVAGFALHEEATGGLAFSDRTWFSQSRSAADEQRGCSGTPTATHSDE